jgi:acyl-CoA reductase-like NAD-dependent aldehyde dehydrogenase
VINPATGKPIAEVTVATVDDAQTALEDVTSPTG